MNAATEDIGKNDPRHDMDAYIRYLPGLSEETTSDHIDIVESNIEYNYELKLFNQLPIDLGWGLQDIVINNGTALKLPAHLTGINTNIETTLSFFNIDHLYVNIGVTPDFFGDSFSFDSSNFKISNRYVLIYKPSENLTLLGGVDIYFHDETSRLPIVGFIYKPNNKLTLDITTDDQNITYALNDKVDLFLEGGISIDEFVVRQDNIKKTVRYTEERFGGGIKLKVNKSVHCSLSAGEVFDGTLKYRDLPGKISLRNEALYTQFSMDLKL